MTGRYAIYTGVYNVVRPGAPWGLPLADRGFDSQCGHMFGAIDYFTHIRDGKPD